MPSHDLKSLMKQQYLQYASYVILDRAIPHVKDGLKPVQRRILHALYQMHDGRFHKVANAVGQTMAFHPHGDAPIYEALVNLANKGYLLDCQGNFGNIYTQDPAAAARYIETRLSSLAMEILFNPQITDFIPSYDGRAKEPLVLPCKIPLLLLQGTEGIAVGMSTKIFPHNFGEVLKAEIALLEGNELDVFPDFPTGGTCDVSEYDYGKGKVRVRATIEIRDPKTLVIREICYGTSTESLIHSIDEQAKRGKIKIDSIHDYTAEHVEIEIKLPRGQYAEEVITQLYAFTECQVSLNSQFVVIKDSNPCELDVRSVLKESSESLLGYLKRELEIERDKLLEEIFAKTLEEIFIENKLYKHLETVSVYEKVFDMLDKQFTPFHERLSRIPTRQDFEKLLLIPIRRIARFDIEKNQSDIQELEKKLQKVRSHLQKLKNYAISFLKNLLEKYGKNYPRKTRIEKFGEIDKKAVATKVITVQFDKATGYVGTKVTGARKFECTNFDKILVFLKDGTFKVINCPEKQFIGKGNEILFVGVADKQTIFSCCFQDKETGYSFAKRFIVKQFILDKSYRFFDEGAILQFFSEEASPKILVHLVPKQKQKVACQDFAFDKVLVKNVSARGVRIAPRPVNRIENLKKESAAYTM